MERINLSQKFALFDERWTPMILAESNGQLVKIAKGLGEIVWHSHQNEGNSSRTMSCFENA